MTATPKKRENWRITATRKSIALRVKLLKAQPYPEEAAKLTAELDKLRTSLADLIVRFPVAA